MGRTALCRGVHLLSSPVLPPDTTVMQGAGEMCDSGGAQPECSPEPGPLVLTRVLGECGVPGSHVSRAHGTLLSDSCSSLVGGGE